MPISSTVATSSGAAGTASGGAKWAPAPGLFTTTSATTIDTAAQLSLPVTAGQVVRYHWESMYAAGNISGSLNAIFSGVTCSQVAMFNFTPGTYTVQPAAFYANSPTGGTPYGNMNWAGNNQMMGWLDADWLVTSNGTIACSVSMFIGAATPIHRRANIQIIG